MGSELIDIGALRAAWASSGLTDDDKDTNAMNLRVRWRAWRRWAKEREEAHKGQGIHTLGWYPNPLILEGIALVSKTLNGTTAAAVVHASAWSDLMASSDARGLAAVRTMTEQWLIFDFASDKTITLKFDGDDGNTYSLTVKPEQYPTRMPTTATTPPDGAQATFWRGVAYGDKITAAAFLDGIKKWVATAPSGIGKTRYACGSVSMKQGLPTGHPEYKPSGVGRKWVEECYSASDAPKVEKSWLYAEWPGAMQTYPGTTAKYTPMNVHMAWQDPGFSFPPAHEAVTALYAAGTPLDHAAWVAFLDPSYPKWLSSLTEVRLFKAADTILLESPPV